jgi:hypothetical protein
VIADSIQGRPLFLAVNCHVPCAASGSAATEGFGEKYRAIVVVVIAAVMIKLPGIRDESEHGRAAITAVKVDERALLHNAGDFLRDRRFLGCHLVLSSMVRFFIDDNMPLLCDYFVNKR